MRIIIQARMSSQRLPGKVLMPFRGRPMIDHIVAAATDTVGPEHVTVATSVSATDDPLAFFLQGRGVDVLRGPLDDVFARFALAARTHPETWFMRLCADSPLMDAGLLKNALSGCSSFAEADIISNVYPRRTFPKGLSIEIVKRRLFTEWNQRDLSAEQREHVTKAFYDNARELNIVGMESDDPADGKTSFVIDTWDDYQRLALTSETVPNFTCRFHAIKSTAP